MAKAKRLIYRGPSIWDISNKKKKTLELSFNEIVVINRAVFQYYNKLKSDEEKLKGTRFEKNNSRALDVAKRLVLFTDDIVGL